MRDNRVKALSLILDSVELMIKNFETQKLFQEHYNESILLEMENVIEALTTLKTKIEETTNG